MDVDTALSFNHRCFISKRGKTGLVDVAGLGDGCGAERPNLIWGVEALGRKATSVSRSAISVANTLGE